MLLFYQTLYIYLYLYHALQVDLIGLVLVFSRETRQETRGKQNKMADGFR